MPALQPICGYPIPGWRLDRVKHDAEFGWVAAVEREADGLQMAARSGADPLEAWNEALQLARNAPPADPS